MQTTVQLDDVLDLVWKHQEELARTIDNQGFGTSAYLYLSEEYKHVSELYDNIRRVANDD